MFMVGENVEGRVKTLLRSGEKFDSWAKDSDFKKRLSKINGIGIQKNLKETANIRSAPGSRHPSYATDQNNYHILIME